MLPLWLGIMYQPILLCLRYDGNLSAAIYLDDMGLSDNLTYSDMFPWQLYWAVSPSKCFLIDLWCLGMPDVLGACSCYLLASWIKIILTVGFKLFWYWLVDCWTFFIWSVQWFQASCSTTCQTRLGPSSPWPRTSSATTPAAPSPSRSSTSGKSRRGSNSGPGLTSSSRRPSSPTRRGSFFWGSFPRSHLRFTALKTNSISTALFFYSTCVYQLQFNEY